MRGMVDRHHGERVGLAAQTLQALDDHRGVEVPGELDQRRAAVPERAGGLVEVGRELAIERVLLLLQQEAHAAGPVPFAQPRPQQRRAVIAQAFRGLEHAPRRGRAHRMALVQDAIDGGDADAGPGREVGDGRPPRHKHLALQDSSSIAASHARFAIKC